MRSTSLLITAASYAALAAADLTFPAEPRWASDGGDCTNRGLTAPSWWIVDYTVTASGQHQFGVENQASGNGASVTCTPGGSCVTANNPSLKATLDTSGPSPVVTINAKWMCSDKGTVLNFAASGSATIFSLQPSSSGGLESPLYWYLAQGTLTQPVPVKPVQPTPPAGYDLDTCGARDTSSPGWTVTDFSYSHYTKPQCKQPYGDIACLDTPDGHFPHFRGDYLNLTIKNEFIDVTVDCSFAAAYGAENLPGALRCTGGNFDQIGLEIDSVLNLPSFGLTIHNLWYCLENKTTNIYPGGILASGTADIELTCTNTTGITGTADDIVTTCTPNSPTTAVSASDVQRQEYYPFALVTAPPASGGCTFDSLVNPEWRFEDPDWTDTYTRDANGTETDIVLTWYRTKLGTPANNVWLQASLSSTDPDAWYDCQLYKPDDPWPCQFSFNLYNQTLSLDQTWECTDKNPDTPLYWTAQGQYTMPEEGLNCGESNPNSDTCSYQGIYVFYRPMSKVTFSAVEPSRK